MHMKQLSLSSYMTVRKDYILKAEQGFLDGVYTEVQISKFIHYYHSRKNKERFLKEKRVKGFFIFMSMLSFKHVESNNDKPCERGCVNAAYDQGDIENPVGVFYR